MANKKPKGNQYLAEAHKKMKSSAKNFGGLLGGNSGQDDAIELLVKAANSFKTDKKWNAAGSAFCEVAVMHLQNDNKQSAGTAYVNAGNCYKKTDTHEAINCLLKAIDIYKNMGKFKIAAKHHMTVAEIYETELVDSEKANIHYQKATHYYKTKESSKTSANGCLQRVTTIQSIEETVLWRRPINTLYYATHELIYQLINLTKWVLCHTRTCSTLLLLSILVTGVSYMDGPHQQWLTIFRKQLLWCLYWCGLGILSSVGLGTGLHTFLLYLGPHIASVTLAAYECDSLDFPSPPYPDEIICPTTSAQSLLSPVNVWSIMSKVRLEAFMWGAGTALGELPPYFVARAHRLAGEEEEELDPDLAQEIVATSSSSVSQKHHKSIAQRFRTQMIRLVTKVGFFGILGCASIPNPLFDLAGITCGYSLVPFWTFFGATLIGKAIIKMHIQKLFVIIAFNENYVELFVHKSRNIPFVGQYLHEPLREFLVKQKKSLHRGSAKQTVKESSYLSMIFEWIVISMIVYFLVSIINSMAQNYQKRALKHSTSEDSEQHINNSNHLKTK